ncbi:ABC transporter ATP-binding protein [Breznakiellaceae bacterium SP9]
MIVVLKDIWKVYPMGTITVDALKGITIELGKGEFVAVAGPSGSGKTTMMNLIGLIDTPTRGSICIEDREISNLGRRQLTQMRQKCIGFVFQSFNLLPVLNVFENVELPLTLKRGTYSKAERKDRVEYLLKEVGLADRRKHVPSELSGGQQQRVAIARALVTRPKIVIADEPTANLDSKNGERILQLMRNVNHEEGTTFIFSTHDPSIWEMADHILFLRDGMVESEQRR